ncbi:MAG TPA: DUF2127 domain-containing protein [Steroidobacteraceae bacterium]|nr:DUF2127 domain-containing protein [Steroidobacteraceae bacterium]
MPRGRVFSEPHLHLAFRISLWFKAAFAAAEIAAGAAAWFMPRELLIRTTAAVVRHLPHVAGSAAVGDYLLHAAREVSASTRHFTVFFLVSHGAIKLWLIAGLLHMRRWYYPAALSVFGLFIIYQVYRFSQTHSLWLLFLSLVDAIVIALTWHEYRYISRRPPPAGAAR